MKRVLGCHPLSHFETSPCQNAKYLCLIIHGEGVDKVKKWIKEGRQDLNDRHESEILVAIRKQVIWLKSIDYNFTGVQALGLLNHRLLRQWWRMVRNYRTTLAWWVCPIISDHTKRPCRNADYSWSLNACEITHTHTHTHTHIYILSRKGVEILINLKVLNSWTRAMVNCNARVGYLLIYSLLWVSCFVRSNHQAPARKNGCNQRYLKIQNNKQWLSSLIKKGHFLVEIS